MVSLLAAIVTLLFQITINAPVTWAGPPFRTDDPETVGYRQWEVDVASQMFTDGDVTSGTAPQFELNYGLSQNVDLHLIAPLFYINPKEGSSHYGFGDIELGIKYRFIQEKGLLPMVGTFPLLELPTGN